MSFPPGIEDPISAIFDLSDRVAEMAPTMRRMYLYTATVVVVFLGIMVFLLLVGLATNLGFAILALIAIVFGAIALSLLRETDRFYRSYLARHRSIKLLQDAEPTPKVPAGPTPIQRLARHLAESNPKIGSLLRTHPESLRYRVRPSGAQSTAPFDLVLVAPGDWSQRVLGLGDAGFAIVARVTPETPTIPYLDSFSRELKSVARRLPGRLVRAILLRTRADPIPEPVYDFVVGHPVEIGHDRVAIEIVTEQADGTYDFVPHVLGVP
jgi:hypothetical protein